MPDSTPADRVLEKFLLVDYTYAGNHHGQTGFRIVLGKVFESQVWGVPFVEGTPRPYNPLVPPELLAHGYPKTPPNVAVLNPSDLYFNPDDGGNYAN